MRMDGWMEERKMPYIKHERRRREGLVSAAKHVWAKFSQELK